MTKSKRAGRRPCPTGAAAAALLAAAWAGAARAQDSFQLASAPAAQALGELSIDELSEISITSVSKRPEAISHAASSVYVITNDAIRQAGALTIPEALRLAPNLEVMRIDALDYSITARGFAGFESANKLLVLIDGRSVYTPLFSGVDWDQHHALLDDLDRIEVISGPGGTLWGANAVNGVVNITSRSAFDTQGGLAVADLGTLDSDVRLRYGAQLGDSGAGRVYATAFKRGDLERATGARADDGWDGWQAGFRTDWALGANTFTVQGDLQDAAIDQSQGFTAGYVRGGNLLGRWTRRFNDGAALEVQAYYDEIKREARALHDELRVWDLQAQHAFSFGGRHSMVVGAGYRITKDEFRTLADPQLLAPPRRRVDIGNVFAQDEIALRPNLLLTLGLKLETNDYTQAEWMPNARLGWRLSDRQFFWGAVSRAIRNPSRIERDFTIAGLVEPGHMGSEKLVAYEAGYRGRVTDAATLSVTAYYHDYDELRTNENVPGRTPPIFVGNTMEGETWGVEAWSEVQVTPAWRVSLGGSLLRKDFRLKPGSRDVARFEAAGADPSWWLKARSHFRLTDRVSLDLAVRAYDDVPRLTASGYVGTPGYAEASARLAWRVTDQFELSLTGHDLLHERHAEASETRRTEVPRSAFVTLRWTP
ncbi:TonB-dependent receptor plug domain-containing protein [Phenylobacterium sp.]|jgi:iron complex outermembrane receptor protein|uniref:TonB-dependent receptor plug domain-containing protein n=1 Tax=Phenylobacterium sp. TaxID=1871053 RepID=UPI002F949925